MRSLNHGDVLVRRRVAGKGAAGGEVWAAGAAARLLEGMAGLGGRWLTLGELDGIRRARGLSEFETGLAMGELLEREAVEIREGPGRRAEGGKLLPAA